jgi:5-methylcytosine-specific restriction endonuclease McrA
LKKSPLKRKTTQAIKNKEARGEKLDTSELSNLCMDAWTSLVKLHADYTCEWCGKPATDAHHMIARAQGNRLRFSPENGVALCKGCHMEFHNRNSLKGWLLFEKKRPASYEFVMAESDRSPLKLSRADLQDLLANLRDQIAQFKGAA